MKTKLIALLLMFVPLVALGEPTPTPTPDKLQVALADMVNKSAQVAGDAKDFLTTQLPEVVRQLLAWKFAENLTWAVLFTIASIILLKYLIKWSRATLAGNVDEVAWIFIGIVAIFNTVLAFLAASSYVTALQIWIAPKVYLIEYAKAMATGH